jgi:outer membrane protein TolC
MNRSQICILIFVVWRSAAAVCPQAGELLSLDLWTLADCQREALRQSGDSRAAERRVEAARATAQQAGRWSNPEFGATALSNERHFAIAQELDVWRKRSAAARLADAQAAGIAARRNLIRRELLEEVARQYWALAASEALASWRAQELEVWDRLLEIRRQEFDAGAFTLVEMLSVRETAAARGQAVRQARFEGEAARAALNTLLGRRPDLPMKISGSLAPAPHVSAQQLLAAALENDPAANEAGMRAVAAGYEIEHEKRRWRPNPRLGPAVKEEGGRWGAGVNLSFSIPIPNRNQEGIRAAEAGKEQALAELEAAELTSAHRAYAVFLRFSELSEAAAEFETRIMPLSEERLRHATSGFEAGDLSEREALLSRLEWLRRIQETEVLRHRREEAASIIELIINPRGPEKSEN